MRIKLFARFIVNAMGQDLKNILNKMRVVNGMKCSETGTTFFGKVINGEGCLAATIIGKLKDRPGNVYLIEPDSEDCDEDWIYTISVNWDGDRSKIHIRCETPDNKIYHNGPISKFFPKKIESAIKKNK